MKLLILWHMHQPSYLNGGILAMPWVFLHAIKDYYDMPYLAFKHNAKVTFNLTPTLLSQILIYEKYGFKKDRFLTLWLKHPKELADTEKEWIIKICKTAVFETMVKPLKRYKYLYSKKDYDENGLIDLEMFFILSWCGNYLKENSAIIKKLLNKQTFNQEDKKTLLNELISFIKNIIPFYKKLFKENMISISTTPFYHPILPLLIDINSAKLSNPDTVLPQNPVSLTDDAKLHIQKAADLFKTLFDKEPAGFWPAEGAVDDKSVNLYKQHGIKWIASDEEVLKKTGIYNPNKIYSLNGINIFFRNHKLSDLIGFSYKYLNAENAVKDFKTQLKEELNIIILDGENPWEYYPANGKEFLETFYETFKRSFDLFDSYIEKPSEELKTIAPGSWIYADFNTWIGDEEKNRAWELLFDTKRDYLNSGKQNAFAQEEFLKAECSDWFWWYGKGHFTNYAKEFDTLFRKHLKNIYNSINLPYPEVLDIPIFGNKEIKNLISRPKDYIYPVIDGEITSFFEWIDAGIINETGNTMQNFQIINTIYYGENEKSFYLRLDGNMEKLKRCKIKIFFENTPLMYNIKINSIAEIEISKTGFNKKSGILRIELLQNGKVVQILPSFTRFAVSLDNKYLKNWFI